MNARLNNTDPEGLQRQTDACSAVIFLFLETSGKYFDIQVGAARSSLDSFRRQCDLLEPSANGKALLASYHNLFAQSLHASGRLLRESVALSTDGQQHFGQLIGQSWIRWSASSQQTINAQFRLLSGLCQSLVAIPR